MKQQQALVGQLFDLGVVQFGQFTLKSGLLSPFYLDFRRIVGHPSVMRHISQSLWQLIEHRQFDHLCGVPYAALGLGATMSVLYDKPMLVKRKEAKKHGTKKLVEGVFHAGQSAVVIDDVISSGISMIETLEALEQEGLVVHDVIAIVDRLQGGSEALANKGYRVTCLFTLPQLMDDLLALGKIDRETHASTLAFIRENSISFEQLRQAKPLPSYPELREQAQHPVAQRLLQTMERKKTNLCCAADVQTGRELLALAQSIGSQICLLKTHIDTLSDFHPDLLPALKAIAAEQDFLLFEDRKFADIGHIAMQQFTQPPFSIADWADVVTVHSVAGSLSIEALKATHRLQNTALILVAEMSTADTLTQGDYLARSLDIAAQHADVVLGVVAQTVRPKAAGQLLLTPGVHLEQTGDGLGQSYHSPQAVFARGTDIAIVGRGIYQAAQAADQAALYRQLCWQAYEQR